LDTYNIDKNLGNNNYLIKTQTRARDEFIRHDYGSFEPGNIYFENHAELEYKGEFFIINHG
jgi:hypothetical protein